MNYTELIDTFGNRIGIDGLAFSRQGSCSVSFDDDELIFELNGNRLFVISDIDIAEDESEALHRVMLEGNHFGYKTGFSCLGLDRRTGSYTLSRVFEGEIEIETFMKEIELFVRALRYWKQYLNGGTTEQKEEFSFPTNVIFA